MSTAPWNTQICRLRKGGSIARLGGEMGKANPASVHLDIQHKRPWACAASHTLVAAVDFGDRTAAGQREKDSSRRTPPPRASECQGAPSSMPAFRIAVRDRSSTIEFLMWCRRRRRMISPLILAASGAARDSGEKRHDNDRSNRLRHRQVAGAAH